MEYKDIKIKSDTPIEYPEYIKDVMSVIKDLDCEVYTYGSAVREIINGHKPIEIEMVCSIKQTAVAEILEGSVIQPDSEYFEVVLYEDAEGRRYIIRTLVDGKPLNGVPLGPNDEFFEALLGDLLKSGFKCDNLMLDVDGYVYDMCDGLEDTKARRISTTLTPEKTFEKHPILILGALELMIHSGYSIPAEVKNAMFKKAHKLAELSQETIGVMMPCLLAGENTATLIDEYFDIFAVCIPELVMLKNCPQNSIYHEYDVYGHTLESMRKFEEYYKDPNDWAMKLVCLLHDIGKPSVKTTDEEGTDHFYNHSSRSALICESILTRWCIEDNIVSALTDIVAYHDIELRPNEQRIVHQYRKYGGIVYKGIVKFRVCDLLAQNTDFIGIRLDNWKKVGDILDRLHEENGNILTTDDLAISGKDLKEMGLKGKQIGDMKIALLNMVIANGVKNELTALKNTAIVLSLTDMYADEEEDAE